MAKLPRRLLAALVPAVLGAAIAARALRAPEVRTTTVVRGTSIAAVYASGAVEAVDRVDVAARVAGPVSEIAFREGDAVKKGDLLVRIDAPVLGLDVTRAQADSVAASTRFGSAPAVESVRAQRAALAAQLAQARGDLARVEALFASGCVGAADLDRVRAQVDALRAQMAASEAQERDLRIALLADAQRQRAVLDSAKTRLSDTEIRSPLTGTVLARKVQVGQVASLNQPLVRVGDLTRLHLEVNVDEADVAQVRIGQPAAIRLYALKNRIVTGKVTKVHPEADRERKSFRVDVDFDEPRPAGIHPGMTAEVNVVLAKHEGVLLAPLEAVRDDRVWVVEDGRVRARAVTVKQKDLTFAEVEGLAEGAEIVVTSPSELAEGVRVRTAPASLAPPRAPAEPAGPTAARP